MIPVVDEVEAVQPTDAEPDAPIVDPPPTPSSERLVSLDAFRGAIMLLMGSSGFGIPQVAKHFPDSPIWAFLGYQFQHPPWGGCSIYDLIQPSFMFMVGVAVPWSLANRLARGQSYRTMFGHALWRALALVLLSIFLQSFSSQRTVWEFPNVLAQIGYGYPLLFLLAFAKPRTQWFAAFGILFAYWLAFALYPLPPQNFDWESVGVPADWPHLSGFAAHWEKNWNFAASFDLWYLNLFPRDAPYTHNAGGYHTLNFIPSLATMIFGLIAGRLMRSDLQINDKLKRLVIAGIAGIVLGKAIELAGICPIVKQIWTPSWAIFSAGIVTLLLAAFVAIIDWRGHERWAFPLVVAGLNPITLYVMWQVFGGTVRESMKIHLGHRIFEIMGATYAPMLERISTLVVFWLILYWMYRRKLFIRI